MAFVLGLDGKIYFDPSGVGGSTWTELTNVKDVTFSGETAEADVTTRANNGWRATVATLKDASIEFEMVYDPSDAGFAAIRDAWLNNSVIGIAAMDGVITVSGVQGFQADCMVTNFGRGEALEEAMTVPVTLKPTFSATAPDWVTIP